MQHESSSTRILAFLFPGATMVSILRDASQGGLCLDKLMGADIVLKQRGA